MKFTSIIVEDLNSAAVLLQRHCERSGIIEVLGHFTSAEEALHFLMVNPVDLIFLDVEMPGKSGFEFLDLLKQKPMVILTTSRTEYAFNAFEYHVTDFLHKPFTYQRFLDSIKKLDRKVQESPSPESFIFIKVNGKLLRINYADILYIESLGDYVKFVTPQKKYITHNTIKNLEATIHSSDFVKVHRSFIVNLNAVEDLQDNNLLVSGNLIPVSKANKTKLVQKLKEVS
ncbi:MAG: LytTR family DNA-binding domain-containing protein [Chitinophagaceae bacterium]|jgi:DNA-binding LytR/AlgR family response regulator|nr:LytTR family DNA-binding domain-containing protein [Chitinophagaceae bacterium]